MGFLEKLASIVKVSLPKLKKASFQFLSNNSHQKYEYHDNRTIVVNIGKLSTHELEEAKQFIKENVSVNGVPLLEENASKTIGDFQKTEQQQATQTILEFFKDKIPPHDFNALRASIYLKELANNGEDIGSLKMDIINRYGMRGNNISNLYSANYFHTYIKPLYEETVGKGLDKAKFDEAYEIIVTQCPFAVFVNSRMSEDETKQTIIDKVETGRKYGITKLNIHGLGSDNVTKVLQVIDQLKPEYFETFQIMSGSTYINVEAAIKKNSQEVLID